MKRLAMPSKQRPSVRNAVELVQIAHDAGVDVSAILAHSGLPSLVGKNFDRTMIGHITHSQFTRLYAECVWSLNKLTSEREGRPEMTKAEIDLLCHSVINCATLREVVDRATAFSAMLIPRAAALSVAVEEGVAEFRMHTFHLYSDVSAFLTDVTGLSMHYRLFSWLIGDDIPLSHAGIRYPQMVSDELARSLFIYPITFDTFDNLFRFPENYLERPVIRSYDELIQLLRWFPFDLEETHSIQAPVSERVRAILRTALQRGAPFPNFMEFARRFDISASTLKRRLAAEGASLTTMKEGARRGAAETLLLDYWDIAMPARSDERSDLGQVVHHLSGEQPLETKLADRE
jgi:hypothetical protein